MGPADIHKIKTPSTTPKNKKEKKKRNIKYKKQIIIIHCIATSHGQSKCNMVFNLLPLHDIVPNAEIIYFEEQMFIYMYIYKLYIVFTAITAQTLLLLKTRCKKHVPVMN